MAAIVERDHPVAGLGQSLDPAGGHPVDDMARAEAVDQEDRLAVALIDEGQIEAIMMEELHGAPFENPAGRLPGISAKRPSTRTIPDATPLR